MKHLTEAISKSKIRNIKRSHDDDFLVYCKEFIHDELPNFEDRTMYSSDLGIELTNTINMDGSITFNSYKAEKILEKWSDYYDWYIDKMEMYDYKPEDYLTIDEETGAVELNIHDNPEITMVRFVIFGVEDILNNCKCKELDKEKVKLTPDVIEDILNAVDKVKKI